MTVKRKPGRPKGPPTLAMKFRFTHEARERLRQIATDSKLSMNEVLRRMVMRP